MMLNVITSNYITPVRKNVQLVESQQWQDHAQLHAHGRTMHTHGANRFLLTACMDVLEKLKNLKSQNFRFSTFSSQDLYFVKTKSVNLFESI